MKRNQAPLPGKVAALLRESRLFVLAAACAIANLFPSDPQTLELGAEVDGQVLSAGRYKVSADGKTLTVTNKGTGLKGPFEVVMVLERVVR